MKDPGRGRKAAVGGLAVLGALIGLVLLVVIPALASVGNPVPPASSPGNVIPTEINNGGQNNDCTYVNSTAPISWRFVSPTTGQYTQTYNGKPVTINLVLSTSGGNQYLKFTITGAVARDVIVKGGANSTWYKYAPGSVTTDGNLHAPRQSTNKLYTISQTTFCLAQVGTIKGTVFKDSNESTTQDSFESGQNGWTVTLLSGSTVLGTTSTAADGSYKFEDQPLGTTYTVCESPPQTDTVTWGQTLPTGNTLCTAPQTAGQQFTLNSAEQIANFGNVPVSTAACGDVAGYEGTYQFDRNCSSQPTKTFVVSTYVDASGAQVALLHPTASAGSQVPIVEKITWTFTGDKQNPIKMVYDDTFPYTALVDMPLCNKDPRTDEFTIPAGTTGVLPATGVNPGDPTPTSCMLASTDQAGGTYVAYVYTEVDGLRVGNG